MRTKKSDGIFSTITSEIDERGSSHQSSQDTTKKAGPNWGSLNFVFFMYFMISCLPVKKFRPFR